MTPESKIKWRVFQRSNSADAKRIQDLLLPACEALYGHTIADQRSILKQHTDCKELFELLQKNKHELAIQDVDIAYLHAILRLCFCAVAKAESARTKL